MQDEFNPIMPSDFKRKIQIEQPQKHFLGSLDKIMGNNI